MHLSADTLDDLLRDVLSSLLDNDKPVVATRGKFVEQIGALLILKNPRARLSRSEAKGTIFSCLGELLWYLSKSNELPFIEYYIKAYRDDSDDGKTIYGGYGPRLFNMQGINQIKNIHDSLKDKSTSRRAVIQLFDAEDINSPHKEVPCTCTLQFLLRENRLHMFTSMRSNDAFKGLPHDIFAFTMLQELIATWLGVDVGEYKHAVGSLHLYESDREKSLSFIEEGHQSSISMPPMPSGNPWPSIEKLLLAESKFRLKDSFQIESLQLENYWLDLALILQAYALPNGSDSSLFEKLIDSMSTDIYGIYIKKLRDSRTNHGIPA